MLSFRVHITELRESKIGLDSFGLTKRSACKHNYTKFCKNVSLGQHTQRYMFVPYITLKAVYILLKV